MHENKVNKTQPVQKQYSKVSQPVKPVQTKTTPVNASNTTSVIRLNVIILQLRNVSG